MNNKATFLTTAALTALLFSTSAQAQNAQARAEVVQSLTVTQTQPLSFGRFSVNGDSGTITIPVDSDTATPNPSSIALLPSTQAAPIQRGQFTVLGPDGVAYVVTGPEAAIDLTGDQGGTMTVNITTPSGGTLTGGQDNFFVGGVLNVVSPQPVGFYTGNYNITASFQ